MRAASGGPGAAAPEGPAADDSRGVTALAVSAAASAAGGVGDRLRHGAPAAPASRRRQDDVGQRLEDVGLDGPARRAPHAGDERRSIESPAVTAGRRGGRRRRSRRRRSRSPSSPATWRGAAGAPRRARRPRGRARALARRPRRPPARSAPAGLRPRRPRRPAGRRARPPGARAPRTRRVSGAVARRVVAVGARPPPPVPARRSRPRRGRGRGAWPGTWRRRPGRSGARRCRRRTGRWPCRC